MSAPLLSLRSVTKRLSGAPVLQDTNIEVHAGERVLLIGANGAGKSTLLRIAAGVLRPERGELHRTKDGYAYLGHDLQLYTALTVRENLTFTARLRGITSFSSTVEQWGLTDLLDRQIRTLSRGTQLRVALARTLLTEPRLLLLDEPTNALDERGVQLLLSYLSRHGTDGRAWVVATHDLTRLVPIANRVIVMEAGQIRHDTGAQGDDDAAARAIAMYREHNR